MGRLRSLMATATALLIATQAAFADDTRIIALPILNVELTSDGFTLVAAVAGKGGQAVDAELTVLREANGSIARTRQAAQVVLSGGAPKSVGTIGFGGDPIDSLKVSLVVTFEGRQIAETSTILNPRIKE